MTILSDKEIIDLCVPPTSVIGYGINRNLSRMTNVDVSNVNFNQFGTTDKEEALKLYPESIVNSKWLNYYRDATGDDLNNWKPMIAPFVSKQVRENKRAPTEIEKAIWNADKYRNDIVPVDANGKPIYEQIKPIQIPDNFVCDNIDIGLQIKEKIISYGTSSYGYDLRCGYKFKIFSNINTTVADPKNFDEKSFVDFEVEKPGDYVIVPPNSFVLAYALEKLNMPKNVTGIVIGKSTYARVGLNCLCTPAEAGWSGHLTLEFANTTPLPVKLYAGEGCCQIMFFEGRVNPLVSYADRKGKYQDQEAEVTLPRT